MSDIVKDFVRLNIRVIIPKYIRIETKNRSKFGTVHNSLFLALLLVINILVPLLYFFDQVVYIQ
jgi:hypothetical protein